MKRALRWTVTVAVALAAVAAFAKIPKLPQTGPEPVYDPATAVEIWGVVVDVRRVPAKALEGVHLDVKTDGGVLDVYLGPSNFVEMFGVTFAKGDMVNVRGSQVRFQGADVVLAREIDRKLETLYLRDESGEPMWKDFALPDTSRPAHAQR